MEVKKCNQMALTVQNSAAHIKHMYAKIEQKHKVFMQHFSDYGKICCGFSVEV